LEATEAALLPIAMVRSTTYNDIDAGRAAAERLAEERG
jgi:hypothetical protein